MYRSSYLLTGHLMQLHHIMFYVYRNSAGCKVLLTITHVSHADRREYPVLRSPALYDSGDTGNWRSTI